MHPDLVVGSGGEALDSGDYPPALAGPGVPDPAAAMSYRDSGTASCRGANS